MAFEINIEIQIYGCNNFYFLVFVSFTFNIKVFVDFYIRKNKCSTI